MLPPTVVAVKTPPTVIFCADEPAAAPNTRPLVAPVLTLTVRAPVRFAVPIVVACVFVRVAVLPVSWMV